VYPKTKSTRCTASADVKAAGGPAHIHKIHISSSGTAGTDGTIEIRDAVSPAGDTGTLRFDTRFDASTDELTATIDFSPPLYMPNGIRVTYVAATETVVWVIWEG
jgi:hypothetical protein